MYTTIIIGAGPAALSAAIYLGRAGLKSLIIGDIENSNFYNAKIENYVGVKSATGEEILLTGLEQAKNYGADNLREEVTLIKNSEGKFIVTTSDMAEHKAKTLIIASGIPSKRAGIEGEQKFEGKGVHYCAMCDGFFYKDKKIAVIGGGNFAAQTVLELKNFTTNITLISDSFNFSEELEGAIKGVELVEEKPLEFNGDKKFESVEFSSGQKEFDGVFIAKGIATPSAFATQLGLIIVDDFVQIDKKGMTNLEGVYAAGNCTGGAMQLTKSAGEGCTSAISIIKKIKKLEKYVDY